MTVSKAVSPSLWAQRLGAAGLIPFVLLAVGLWVLPPPLHPFVAQALVGYGATIASFLGALHWGLVMRDATRQTPALLGWGVMPSLLAWVALLVGPAPGLLVLAALLWVCYAFDRLIYPRFQVQGWLPMRLTLTAVASLSCVAGAARLLVAA